MATTKTVTGTTPTELIELDLDRLYEITALVDEVETDIATIVNEAIVKSGLSAKYNALLKKLNAKKALQKAAETRVKTLVGGVGETVKGEHLMAVYSDGRVTWDTKEMDGYMVAHPEIKQFRNVGKPSVAIREVKSHNDEE